MDTHSGKISPIHTPSLSLSVSPSFSSRSLPGGRESETSLYYSPRSLQLSLYQLPNARSVHSTAGGATLRASINGERHVSTFQPLQLCFPAAGQKYIHTKKQSWSCSNTATYLVPRALQHMCTNTITVSPGSAPTRTHTYSIDYG